MKVHLHFHPEGKMWKNKCKEILERRGNSLLNLAISNIMRFSTIDCASRTKFPRLAITFMGMMSLSLHNLGLLSSSIMLIVMQ